MVRIFSRAGFGAALLFAGPALAQTTENVIVTATHLAGGVEGSNADVIDADAIAARQPSSVVELLRGLPDVYVQQAGGRGSVVSLFTRGAKPNFTLVLLDGVKANDPTNTRGGSYDFSSLDLNDIERVESVRGPASAVYGSDAMGGVINIISRKGSATPQAGIEAEGGMDGFWRAAAHVSGPVGGATGNVGVAYTDSGMPVEGSTMRGTNLDGALSLPEMAGIAISLNGRYSDSIATSFPDSSGGPRLAILRDLDHRDIDEGVFGAHASRTMSQLWTMTLDYGFYDRSGRTRSPGVAPSSQTPTGIPASTDDARFTRNQLTWTNRLALAGLDIAAGLDLQVEHGADSGALDFGGFAVPTDFTLDRTLWAAFAEARYQVTPRFSLSASGRYDNNAGTSHTSPQLRADYVLPDWGTQFQLSWSQAYKLPSFYALGNPLVGDPTLRPESAHNLEGGVTQALGDWGRWKFEAYDTHYSDLIDFQPGAVPKLVNLSRVHVQGFETSLALAWGAFGVSPHLSYTDARNEATGAGLRDVPAWLAGGSLTWKPDAATMVSFDLTQVGPLTDNSVPTGDVRLPGHLRADLAVSYAVRPGMRVHVAVENLFDARYEDVVGFPAPGALLRAGVSADF